MQCCFCIFGLLTLLTLTGCAPVLSDNSPRIYHNDHISEDTVWSGRILIDGTVKVAKGATLTIAPGTEIAFVRRDSDADGLGDAVLAVEGRLLAVGTRQQPIRFHSAAANPAPGDWLEIRVDFSQEVHLRYCDIRDSAYTLHAHFTRGVVEDCTIHHNIDGCRLGQATFTFRNNLIEHNLGKGINFRNSKVDIHHNILRYNDSGIFLFESDRAFDVHHNNFYSNIDNFRLGDFYADDVSLHDNWWGASDLAAARASVFDQSQDPTIGAVTLQPQPQWISESGPRDSLELLPAWSYTTAGYVDAAPVVAAEKLYALSWDGSLHVLDQTGKTLWTRSFGDTLDATPVLSDELLILQNWSREVYALDVASRQLRWRFDYSPSPADDHRQAGLLLVDDLVLVPAWNGTLFALDVATGERRWDFAGGQPLRARPTWDGTTLYLSSGNGTLSSLTTAGELRWQRSLGAPLLSSPALTPQGVVVVSREGSVNHYDQDGQIVWQRDLTETCYYAAPVYHDQAVFVATAGGALWKLEAATGRVLWRVAISGPSYATPLIADGRVFVGDNSGTLQVLNADSGQLLTTYRLDREIQGRPLLWSGQLLVGSRDHKIHALTLVEPAKL